MLHRVCQARKLQSIRGIDEEVFLMSLPERALFPASPKPYGLPRSAPRRIVPQDLDATLPLAPQRAPEACQVLPMKCLYCQAPVERGTTEVRVDRNGYHLSWQTVPAWVCTRCDQAYFEPHEVDMVRRAVSAMTRLGK
jgi:YgiT-type zinc finger domain-containing protein